ncbi:uroporphyrinogen decarboxylase, isoform CRA_b [Rattus norvegicus]|uniref:Uroporphyrinogen decarboxylase, isoform CRA_b n=1 Tax=Rattus norvegicus TaxID=10116 RepID=A6JZB4_RAT|nr:uroporphyrinogen decarboxylase, isoform CRA_b [Rattus norvegicus]
MDILPWKSWPRLAMR